MPNNFSSAEGAIPALSPDLTIREIRVRAVSVPLKDRDALECFYKGVHEFFKMSKEPIGRARNYFVIVDKKQPSVSIGATWVALCHWFDAFKGWGSDPAGSLVQAGVWSQKAVQMEDADG
jgi:hypothetical protein